MVIYSDYISEKVDIKISRVYHVAASSWYEILNLEYSNGR